MAAEIVSYVTRVAAAGAAVLRIADKYGHQYFVFLGVHLPEEYGGGGSGLTELAAVIEEELHRQPQPRPARSH